MRAPRILKRIVRDKREAEKEQTVLALVRGEMNAWRQEQGFAPTSGYASTERAQPDRDWHRPTIGFSPNGI